MYLKKKNSIISGLLVVSMLTALGIQYSPSTKLGSVVEAAVVGDEGSDGLSCIEELTASSPDGKIRVKIWDDEFGAYYYSTYLEDHVVLQCSPIGIVTSDEDLSVGLSFDESSKKIEAGKDEYDLVQGPVNHVNKEYNDLSFDLKKGNATVTMRFRLSNDGMAYRYQVDADTTSDSEFVSVTGEDSSFVLPDETTVWTINPSVTYEAGEYTKRTIDQVRSSNASYSTPLLAEVGGTEAWVLLSEASVYNNADPYCASIFQTKSNNKAVQVRFGDYLIGEDDMNNHGQIGWQKYERIKNVDFSDTFETPWRVAIIGKDLNAITSSTMIPDLNPAAKGDFSWVTPGTSVWSWWSTSSDAIDYDSMFDYIDFCSNAGIEYCLVDYGWEVWSDYEAKIATLVEYANERNVGLLLWYGVHKIDNAHIFDLDNEADIEEQFAWCEKMGIKGVKVDYLNSDSQYAMKNMYWIADIAAKYHQVVNYHGCTNPNGENRTYPNILSSEAVCGMEYFKWSSASPVKTLITLPYTRNVIGSMEYTPALYSVPNSPATTGFMLSMCIQYESAVQTFAQSGYVYPGYSAFSLIADVPSTWDESILVSGYPDEEIVRARRSGENWYLAAMTNDATTMDVPLEFLEEGYNYYAYLYEDNEDGTDIEVSTKIVTSKDSLSLKLLQYGGASVKFTKKDPIKWTVYDNYTYYEAEDATLSGSVSIATEKAYVSGRAFVQGIGNNANNTLTFENVNVPEDGTYQFKVYVVSSSKRNLFVKVNDDETYDMPELVGIPGDGNAVGDSGDYIDIELKAGDNTIVLFNNSQTAPNVDRIAVSKALLDDSEIILSQNKYVFNGKECKPNVTVKRKGVTLSEGKEYSVFYSNNIEAGNAKVYVTGINGFGSQLSVPYTIEAPVQPTPIVTDKPVVTSAPIQVSTQAPVLTVTKPGKMTLSTVKSSKKKQMKVTFKKKSDVAGYQVVYSTSKKFKKATKATIKKSATSKTFKKLKSGKRYYVKVRAYNTNNGTKLYGSWSKVKSVKVK